LVVDLAYELLLLLVVFGVFLVVAGRLATRSVRSTARQVPDTKDVGQFLDDAVGEIRGRLERGEAPPLSEKTEGQITVFVSGHTHAPSLTRFGQGGALVNSGCWLRQLQSVPARFGAPPVFVSHFVQTHVRVYREEAGIQVELREHPRPARQRLLQVERLAVAGRLPAEPGNDALPRVQAGASVDTA
jgi:hypothetical protein